MSIRPWLCIYAISCQYEYAKESKGQLFHDDVDSVLLSRAKIPDAVDGPARGHVACKTTTDDAVRNRALGERGNFSHSMPRDLNRPAAQRFFDFQTHREYIMSDIATGK
jgi:hypothetical protein